MKPPILYWIDAFTDDLFEGNPAAVCLCETAPSPKWMHAVAAELNLSETAFVSALSPGIFSLRWFTPNCEVDLCGHATLASALALWHNDTSLANVIHFQTKSGTLELNRRDTQIELNFPIDKTHLVSVPSSIHNLFGINVIRCAESKFGLIAELKSEEFLRGWQANIESIKELPYSALVITASSRNYDFVSRVFAPKLGIDEDPVTGAAHCALADYWSVQLDKKQLKAKQVSKRSGELALKLQKDRILLTGRGKILFRGQFEGSY